jgi:hypothetical protein
VFSSTHYTRCIKQNVAQTIAAEIESMPGHVIEAVQDAVSIKGGQSAPAPLLGPSIVRVRVRTPPEPHVTEQLLNIPKADTTQSPNIYPIFNRVHYFVLRGNEIKD